MCCVDRSRGLTQDSAWDGQGDDVESNVNGCAYLLTGRGQAHHAGKHQAVVESLAIVCDRDLAVTQGQVQHMTIIQDRFPELVGPPTKIHVVFYANLVWQVNWLHAVGLVRSVTQGVCARNRRILCKKPTGTFSPKVLPSRELVENGKVIAQHGAASLPLPLTGFRVYSTGAKRISAFREHLSLPWHASNTVENVTAGIVESDKTTLS